MTTGIEDKLRALALKHAGQLKKKIEARVAEMEADDDSHYLIYRVLGISESEGKSTDVYQNKGRFLYRHAGTFLEAATKLCFEERFPGSGTVRIPNTIGQRPKTFEIDCLVEDRDAVEIKWRDATTDGDHITKEHTRMQCISDAGYKPIRVMFFYPNRAQAQRIQKTLEELYGKAGGEYHYGPAAWDYVASYTGVDLKGLVEKIAQENAGDG